MFKNKKKAFTLIELLVVIAIIGILATLAVVALQQARQNARDAKRVSDMKQLQTAMELFFNENGRYPTTEEWDSGSIVSSSTGETFMYSIPSAPTPADGDCQAASNTYAYLPSLDGSSYTIDFCTGKQVSDLPAGVLCLTPGGMKVCDDQTGGESVATYSVVYNSNSATGGTVPDSQIKTQDIDLILQTNSGGLFKTGFIFAGWNTLSDGSGVGYSPGSNYTENNALVLYAVWCEDSVVGKSPDSQVYGVVSGSNATCWLDRNLGATRVATAYNDSQSYGYVYQWGRSSDGHQIRTSGSTSTLSSTDNPGHSNFILAPGYAYDWRNPQNNSLWQGESGINNPCPSGWRVPTKAELENEIISWSNSGNRLIDAFNSSLKWPSAGLRSSNDGNFYNLGSYVSVWSSDVDGGIDSRVMIVNSSNAFCSIGHRAGGLSVRCIKD